MAHSLSHRLPALIVASAAATALATAPALASEGTTAPPPSPLLPSGLAPVMLPPLLPGIAAPVHSRRARVITRARLIPRHVRRGHRPRLRLRLTAPSRLRIVVSRRAGNGRKHVLTIKRRARSRKFSMRLPVRSHGRLLRRNRYRVRIVAIDASGARSLPVSRKLIVR
jgi:hypothetical protein